MWPCCTVEIDASTDQLSVHETAYFDCVCLLSVDSSLIERMETRIQHLRNTSIGASSLGECLNDD